jgi:peptidoglycan/LPS O-acetylase OafA/YrhL
MDDADGRPTGFDYLRLLLSVGVLLGHTVSSSYGRQAAEALYDSPATGLLRCILPMFFALSGFLVAGSMERCRTLIKFLGLRAIRIYPALIVEVLLSALLIGPLVTTVPLHEYFTDSQFWRYIVNVTGHITFFLPGVFHDNPNPDVVNGQLWTVPFELYCYITLAALIAVGAKRFKAIVPLGALGLLVVLTAHRANLGVAFIEYWRAIDGPRLVVIFLLGVSAYLYRDKIPHSQPLFWASALASVILLGFVPNGTYLALFTITYATAYLGTTNPKKTGVIKHADYSYGIFLYGYVVQQLVMYVIPAAREWYWNFLICLPLSVAVAAFSWHFVEKPALRLKPWTERAENAFLSWRAGRGAKPPTPVTSDAQ